MSHPSLFCSAGGAVAAASGDLGGGAKLSRRGDWQAARILQPDGRRCKRQPPGCNSSVTMAIRWINQRAETQHSAASRALDSRRNRPPPMDEAAAAAKGCDGGSQQNKTAS